MRRLWTALVALAAADAVTTVAAIQMGLPEANPLLASLVGMMGLLAIPLSKVAYVGAAGLLARSVDRSDRKPVLLAGIVPSAMVVGNNLLAVAFLGWSA